MKLILNPSDSDPRFEYDVSEEIQALWDEVELDRLLRAWDDRLSDRDAVQMLLNSPWERGMLEAAE